MATEKCHESHDALNTCPSNKALYGKLKEALEALVKTCDEIENLTTAPTDPITINVDGNVAMFANGYIAYSGWTVPTSTTADLIA